MRPYAASLKVKWPQKLEPNSKEYATERPFVRSDGATSRDKTRGWHSRPVQKETRRNANRAANKRARQRLKNQTAKDLTEQ